MLSNKGLRIQASSIPNAGKGLFAQDKRRPLGQVVFRKGDLIAPYDGQIIGKSALESRYGVWTAPYAMQVTADRFEDGACHRGIATVVNAAPHRRRVNAEFYRGKGSVIKLRAVKIIRNGDEILADYGHDYGWDEPTTYRTRSVSRVR